MFEQTFRNIDVILRREMSSELDYVEQTSWLLFLKYLDALERERAQQAELDGRTYSFLLDKKFHWNVWAVPRTVHGALDHNHALIGDDLCEFVDKKLFPYLKDFKARASGRRTVEYKIGEIFGEIKNKFQSGYNLRECLELVDGLSFNTQSEKHELSSLYEGKIQKMGNAGRNGGEYYTPRPLIRAILEVVQPKIGETVYDGALGSAGFLCEAFARMSRGKLSLPIISMRSAPSAISAPVLPRGPTTQRSPISSTPSARNSSPRSSASSIFKILAVAFQRQDSSQRIRFSVRPVNCFRGRSPRGGFWRSNLSQQI